jgi:hypothetical protein
MVHEVTTHVKQDPCLVTVKCNGVNGFFHQPGIALEELSRGISQSKQALGCSLGDLVAGTET